MSEENDEITRMEIPIDWHFPSDIISRYATNMTVQGTPNEVIISFFELFPPMVLGPTPEATQAQVMRIKSLQAKCVARLVILPDKLPEFIEVLQKSLDGFEARKKDTGA